MKFNLPYLTAWNKYPATAKSSNPIPLKTGQSLYNLNSINALNLNTETPHGSVPAEY